MADYPPSVLAATERAIIEAASDFSRDDINERSSRKLARAALEAAAPLLAEAVAAKITEHKYAHEPKGPLIGGKAAEEQRRRTWRRHFSIAAQVASLAFSSREDQLRMAAEAIERGEVIACDIPEVPGD